MSAAIVQQDYITSDCYECVINIGWELCDQFCSENALEFLKERLSPPSPPPPFPPPPTSAGASIFRLIFILLCLTANAR